MTNSFNPKEHLIQIKSNQGTKDYLPVQWRLVWFNEKCPNGKITILEQCIDLEREITKEVYEWNAEKRRSEKVVKTARGYAWFRVRAEDGNGKVGEAFGSECAVDFEDYAEKADTKATGRALAKIGFGTQFVGDEFDEAHRIVDAPVERAAKTSSAATKQQIASIEKLCQSLGRATLHVETYNEAAEAIKTLSEQYHKKQSASSGK